MTGVNSGVEALDEVEARPFDVVFLDENMPGINGIETLQRIKDKHPGVPVIMITKSEEEHIMEEAIGSKISDYPDQACEPQSNLVVRQENFGQPEVAGRTSPVHVHARVP